MPTLWPTNREGTERVEMARDEDVGRQIHALMIAIHDLREDVALLQRATGVPPAGEREIYPTALAEMPDLRGAIADLADAVQVADTAQGARAQLDSARSHLRLAGDR